jgi:hypothetical protein
MVKPKTSKEPEIELDAWQRFERAVDVVAKSPPQHKTRGKPKASQKKAVGDKKK